MKKLWRITSIVAALLVTASLPVHGQWTGTQKLTPDQSGSLGSSVAALGDGTDRALALTDRLNNLAHVYRFDDTSGTWTLEQVLTLAPNLSLHLVAGDDPDVIAFSNFAGLVSIWRRSPDTGTWSEEQQFTGGPAFGADMALDRSRLVVGDPDPSTPLVHVFHYDPDTQTWQQEESVAPRTPPYSGFGFGIGLHRDALAVASINGWIEIFQYDRVSSTWQWSQNISNDDPASGFGYPIVIDGSRLVTGAVYESNFRGSAYIYAFDDSSTSWEQEAYFPGVSPDDFGFGFALDVEGDTLVVGSFGASSHGAPFSGLAYAYRRMGSGGWLLDQTLAASDPQTNANFGSGVAIRGGVIVAGAPGYVDESKQIWTGAAYTFYRRMCRLGAVDCANTDSAPLDTLLVNGEAGGIGGEVAVDAGDPIQASLLLPPAGGSGLFVVHANFGEGGLETESILPGRAGLACFPMVDITADAGWNNIGWEHRVGSSHGFDGEPIAAPATAPTTFLDLPAGDATHLPVGTVVTFQGVVADPASCGRRLQSATNAVILRVQ